MNVGKSLSAGGAWYRSDTRDAGDAGAKVGQAALAREPHHWHARALAARAKAALTGEAATAVRPKARPALAGTPLGLRRFDAAMQKSGSAREDMATTPAMHRPLAAPARRAAPTVTVALPPVLDTVMSEHFWTGATRAQRRADALHGVRLVRSAFSAAVAADKPAVDLAEALVAYLDERAAGCPVRAVQAVVLGAYNGLASDASPETVTAWSRALLRCHASRALEPVMRRFAWAVCQSAAGREDRVRQVLGAIAPAAHAPGARSLLRALLTSNPFLSKPSLSGMMAELPFASMQALFDLMRTALPRFDVYAPTASSDECRNTMVRWATELANTRPMGDDTPAQQLQLVLALLAATAEDYWLSKAVEDAFIRADGPGLAAGLIHRRARRILDAPPRVLEERCLTPGQRLQVLHVLWKRGTGACTASQVHEQLARITRHANEPLLALGALSLLASAGARHLTAWQLTPVCSAALDLVREIDLQGAMQAGPASRQAPALPADCEARIAPGPEMRVESVGQYPERSERLQRQSMADFARALAQDRTDVREATSHLVAIYLAFERLPAVERVYHAQDQDTMPVEPAVLEAHVAWLRAQIRTLSRPEYREVHAITRNQAFVTIGRLLEPLAAALERSRLPGGSGLQAAEEPLDA